MSIKIALVGNPNSGKTTLFNELTGSSQYVGNWPGVTVEKKEGKLKSDKDVTVVDLPGIYSLSPYTLEEVVTRKYLIEEKPNVVINLVDASNIERNLYLTTQIIETGLPVVIALNMMDIVNKRGDKIDTEQLSNSLGCVIVETSALKSDGLDELVSQTIKLANRPKGNTINNLIKFEPKLENYINEVSTFIKDKTDTRQRRWFSIKTLERDDKILQKFDFSTDLSEKIETLTKDCEKHFDDDTESIITNARYDFIEKLVKKSVKKKNTSNVTLSDKIDYIVTNKFLALPIFAVIMFLIYYISVSTLGAFLTDWVNEVLFEEIIMGNVSNWLVALNCSELLEGFIVEALIGGVGAVLGFLPQLMLLFLFLAILEDCGYMARIAFIMDKLFRKFGLSGKSFIPILIGTGCGVPGIMASRTIESESDRKITIMTTTFIPCGAKLPIIALIAGALFDGAAWVAPSAYFMGMFAIVFSGIFLKNTFFKNGETTPFVMELPNYHIPTAKNVLLQMWDKGKSFVIKAGTIIFFSCGIIWFLESFDWRINPVDAGDSMLADVGTVIAPIFRPLGWGDWKSAVATLTGLVAKENVVATLGVLFGAAEVSETGAEYWSAIQENYTAVSGFSFLVFNLLCAPCFAAMGAIKREMVSWKWTFIALAYQTGFAYIVALLVNLYGNAIFYDTGYLSAIIVTAILIFSISFLFISNNPKQKKVKIEIS